MRPHIGGVERWAREMGRRLPALAPARYRGAAPPALMSGAAGQGWEQVVLPAIARRERTPLIFNPANLAPLGFTGNVVVIHDAAAIREPGWYSPAYARWQSMVLPRIASRARAVITPSGFARTELASLLGIPDAKIYVIPGGVDDRFSPTANAGAVAEVLGIASPYVLTVASRTSRKNLASLGQAAHALRAEGIELVVAGGDRSELRDVGLDPGIRLLGNVPDELLPGLYAGARAFVLPSLHEGFGLTALEAMRTGLPVVVTRNGALPELCGEAGIYVEANDPSGIAEALVEAAGIERPVAASLERAAEYSWERTAREVDALIGRLLET